MDKETRHREQLEHELAEIVDNEVKRRLSVHTKVLESDLNEWKAKFNEKTHAENLLVVERDQLRASWRGAQELVKEKQKTLEDTSAQLTRAYARVNTLERLQAEHTAVVEKLDARHIEDARTIQKLEEELTRLHPLRSVFTNGRTPEEYVVLTATRNGFDPEKHSVSGAPHPWHYALAWLEDKAFICKLAQEKADRLEKQVREFDSINKAWGRNVAAADSVIHDLTKRLQTILDIARAHGLTHAGTPLPTPLPSDWPHTLFDEAVVYIQGVLQEQSAHIQRLRKDGHCDLCAAHMEDYRQVQKELNALSARVMALADKHGFKESLPEQALAYLESLFTQRAAEFATLKKEFDAERSDAAAARRNVEQLRSRVRLLEVETNRTSTQAMPWGRLADAGWSIATMNHYRQNTVSGPRRHLFVLLTAVAPDGTTVTAIKAEGWDEVQVFKELEWKAGLT